MGLDMYFEKKTYIGNKWKKPKEQIEIKIKDVKQERVSEVTEEVGYLRKANAIHKWLVTNIQDGKDNCAEYYFSEEKIKELLSIIKDVLKNPKLASTHLPTQSGFFFGGTDYDEWYFNKLKKAKRFLKIMLEEESDYYYHSSW